MEQRAKGTLSSAYGFGCSIDSEGTLGSVVQSFRAVQGTQGTCWVLHNRLGKCVELRGRTELRALGWDGELNSEGTLSSVQRLGAVHAEVVGGHSR